MPARKVPRSIHENARDVARDIARTQAYVTSRRERKKIEMADIYWLNAQREILTTSVESSGSNAARAFNGCRENFALSIEPIDVRHLDIFFRSRRDVT